MLFYTYHLYMDYKNLKQINIYIKKKQTHKCRKQTNGYQWDERRGEGQNMGVGLRDTSYYV